MMTGGRFDPRPTPEILLRGVAADITQACGARHRGGVPGGNAGRMPPADLCYPHNPSGFGMILRHNAALLPERVRLQVTDVHTVPVDFPLGLAG
ncbi:hypothetical protein P3T36_006616 [Kitasatospora sp. MAP12-15]|nr:hypothetical protein [Kitasatospora sp. MAP12-44]